MKNDEVRLLITKYIKYVKGNAVKHVELVFSSPAFFKHCKATVDANEVCFITCLLTERHDEHHLLVPP